MPHRNAALTPAGRLKLARLIVDDRWPIRRAAERFQVSWTTAVRWADRLLQVDDVPGSGVTRRAGSAADSDYALIAVAVSSAAPVAASARSAGVGKRVGSSGVSNAIEDSDR